MPYACIGPAIPDVGTMGDIGGADEAATEDAQDGPKSEACTCAIPCAGADIAGAIVDGSAACAVGTV